MRYRVARLGQPLNAFQSTGAAQGLKDRALLFVAAALALGDHTERWCSRFGAL